ncbi:MAG: hypothetical protein NVSMB57_00870 [Actinomycetota bacterium]
MVHAQIETVPVVEQGGIRSALRGIPGWLVILSVAITSVAAWYLLSFSSTNYRGGFPRPDQPVATSSAPAH